MKSSLSILKGHYKIPRVCSPGMEALHDPYNSTTSWPRSTGRPQECHLVDWGGSGTAKWLDKCILFFFLFLHTKFIFNHVLKKCQIFASVRLGYILWVTVTQKRSFVSGNVMWETSLCHVVRKSDSENIISGFLAAGSGAELRAECECCVILTWSHYFPEASSRVSQRGGRIDILVITADRSTYLWQFLFFCLLKSCYIIFLIYLGRPFLESWSPDGG